MDNSNNQNPNEMNNSFDPYQGQDPYASLKPNMNPPMDSNPYQNQDPYASLNPDNYMDANSPFDNQSFNNFGGQDLNYQDNSFANQGQSFQDNGFANQDLNYQNNDFSNQNQGFQDNGFADQSQNYQDNSFANQGQSFQNNGFADTSQNYQNNDFSNQNQAFQDNGFPDQNQNYQDNGFANQEQNFQDNGFVNQNQGFQDNGFADQNQNYQDNNFASQDYGVNSANNYDDYTIGFFKSWMGNLYDKANKSKFNGSAAISSIFGGIYFVYRKMFLTGILFTILQFLLLFLSLFLFTKLGPIALAITAGIIVTFMLIEGFGFYPLYKNFVKNKLNTFKKSTQDNNQLLNMASQKGGTSPIALASYCICIPIVIAIVLALLVNFDVISFGSNSKNTETPNDETTGNVEEETQNMQSFAFMDDYNIKYNADTWFFNETDKSLTKGSYVLTYSGQAVANIKDVFSYDVTTSEGRSSLLNTLVSSLQQQGAQLNMSVEQGLSTFVVGPSNTSAYYSYIDVTADTNLSRYYLILVPEDDILFQFVLSTDDTTIDSETNLDIIEILTSVSKSSENDNDESANDNLEDDSNVLDENTTLDDNEVTDENTGNNVSNEISSTVSNTTTDQAGEADNTTNDNTVPNTNDNSVASGNTVDSPELGEFLR